MSGRRSLWGQMRVEGTSATVYVWIGVFQSGAEQILTTDIPSPDTADETHRLTLVHARRDAAERMRRLAEQVQRRAQRENDPLVRVELREYHWEPAMPDDINAVPYTLQAKRGIMIDGTVLQAGNGGRGFVIETEASRFVVTAAHCLSALPPAHAAAYTEERTFRDFLGPLGGKQDVWAECAFVDPVADLAVFCDPDYEELPDKAEAYSSLIDSATPFALGTLRLRRERHRLSDGTMISGPATATSEELMLSLDGEWFSCRVTSHGRSLWIKQAAQPIRSGMSGSPIILSDGRAVGVVCVSVEAGHEGGPNPVLSASLPAWLARRSQ